MLDLFTKLKISPNALHHRPNFNYGLEGLRGLCAIGVLTGHGLGQSWLDTEYRPEGILPYISFGSLAVYLFFMLSGYVIGLSILRNRQFNIGNFYKRRLLRLYPIYLIIFIPLLWLGTDTTIGQTIGNLLMLQNSRDYFGLQIAVVSNLLPIWSINYEVLYYLLFPLIFFIKPNYLALATALLVCGFLGYYTKFPTFIADYAIGYIFWITGLLMCWKLKSNNRGNYSVLSYIFLLMCSHHLAYGHIILNALHLNAIKDHGLGLEVLFFLPVCILTIADFGGKKLQFRNHLLVFSYGLPLLVFAYLIYSNRIMENDRWTSCFIFYVLSIATLKIKTYNEHVIRFCAKVGAISYALYIIHTPLMFTIEKYFPYQGFYAYWVKFIIWLVAVFVLSYLLEKKMQPALMNFLKRKNAL